MDVSDSDQSFMNLKSRKSIERKISCRKYEAKRLERTKRKRRLQRKRHILALVTSSDSDYSASTYSNSTLDSRKHQPIQRKPHTPPLVTSSDSDTSTTSYSNSISDSEHCKMKSVHECEPTGIFVPEACEDIEVSDQTSSTDSLSVLHDSSDTLWDDLCNIALQTNMTEVQINGILKILRKYHVGPLPLDCRTLKK